MSERVVYGKAVVGSVLAVLVGLPLLVRTAQPTAVAAYAYVAKPGDIILLPGGDTITIGGVPSASPSATPSAEPSPTPSPTPGSPSPTATSSAPTPTSSPSSTSSPSPSPSPTSTPTTTPPSTPPTEGGLPDLTRVYLDGLARSGAAYDSVVAAASLGARPDLSDQNSAGSAAILARAYLGRDIAADLAAAQASLPRVSRTLSLARESQPLALAARLTGQDATTLLRGILALKGLESRGIGAGTLRDSALLDPTNWGAHARAAYLWTAWGLDDPAMIAEGYDALVRYLTTGDGFAYKSDQQSWQPVPSPSSAWVTVGPVGASRDGCDLDGALTNDAYRGGGPCSLKGDGANYTWEGFQGTVSAAIAADMAGHPEVWGLGDRAILRAGLWMYRMGVPATGDDQWIGWVLREIYGADWPHTLAAAPTAGKGWAWTAWTWP